MGKDGSDRKKGARRAPLLETESACVHLRHVSATNCAPQLRRDYDYHVACSTAN